MDQACWVCGQRVAARITRVPESKTLGETEPCCWCGGGEAWVVWCRVGHASEGVNSQRHLAGEDSRILPGSPCVLKAYAGLASAPRTTTLQ